MVQPKKYLGQHFLTDPGIANRIADLLSTDSNSLLMEIGPGQGILTDFLLQKSVKEFIAIEVDPEAVEFLENRYKNRQLKILREDFLKLPEAYFAHPDITIIGNLPYNISSQIFFKILEHRQSVKQVSCMIQKEVAERIVAPPGSKTYGILSVLLQAYYQVQHQFNVKPGSFYPPPKVHSSVITLQRNNTWQLACNEALFFRIVKASFNQRRKMIRNSLKTILLTLAEDFELLSKRPEQLSVTEFVDLTNWLESKM